MVYCVQLHAFWGRTQDRGRFLAIADQGFQPNSIWGPNVLQNITARAAGDPGVQCERRYNLEADAQDLYNRFSAAWDVRPPVAGRDSFLRIHACPHDEGGGACQVTAERTA